MLKEAQVFEIRWLYDRSYNGWFFFSEIVKLTIDAFVDLIETCLNDKFEERLLERLQREGLIQDKTLKGFLKSFIKSLAIKAYGE